MSRLNIFFVNFASLEIEVDVFKLGTSLESYSALGKKTHLNKFKLARMALHEALPKYSLYF